MPRFDVATDTDSCPDCGARFIVAPCRSCKGKGQTLLFLKCKDCDGIGKKMVCPNFLSWADNSYSWWCIRVCQPEKWQRRATEVFQPLAIVTRS